MTVRILALADQMPPADVSSMVRDNAVRAIITLGDLEPEWLPDLSALGVPVLGVHGNHDAADALVAIGARDLHLRRETIEGWTMTGFHGCVRYRHGDQPFQYTQAEAVRLTRKLMPADVLVCHCPPEGINDEPDDPAHTGFTALRTWVDRHRPRYVLHGHTTPDPRRRVHRLGTTDVVWVRGARVLELERR